MCGTPPGGNETGAIHSVDLNVSPEVNAKANADVNAVGAPEGQWERIPMKVDSGAVATVMPPSVAKHFQVTETKLSKNGPGFRAANGTPIKHYGQKTINGFGDQFQALGLVAQVADVNSTLGSVNQMLKAGQCVHFQTGNCYIQDLRTGKKTVMEEKNGTFEVGIWVPRTGARASQPTKTTGMNQSLGAVNANRVISTHNRFSVLESDNDDAVCKMSGFTRQDELM